MKKIRPVVLCGGSGTRLWPLSRTGFPKQFLALAGEQTLFQECVERLSGLDAHNVETLPFFVVCNEEHRFIAQEQLREIGVESAKYLLEPVGRNTAPALTFAALEALDCVDDPVLVVVPADQTISDTPSFLKCLNEAVEAACAEDIVILGVEPDRPETGYGYINATPAVQDGQPHGVQCFVEKPSQEVACQYLKEGGYYWNAGMFIVKASIWLETLKNFRPDIFEATQRAWLGRRQDASFVRPDKDLFAKIPSESVDYAVMERCPGYRSISMVPLRAGWSDLGAWDAVWGVQSQNEEGNVFNGDVFSVESANNLAYSTHRLVGLVGVENLIVVETADAVLVADKSKSQGVKAIVDKLRDANREEQVLHRKVQRPWGWYDSIDQGDCFKVKRIQVKPGARLSLQKHQHRAEHWIVVKGIAEITCGDKVIRLCENQSTYIPLGELHRLSNPGIEPLEIIEVQSGKYLGEDDIIRIEDNYGRGGAC